MLRTTRVVGALALPAVLTAMIAAGVTGCSTEQPEIAVTASPSDKYAHTRSVATCLQEGGWGVQFNESDGSYETTDGIPEAQYPQYEADRATCETEAPAEEVVELSEFTSEQWSQLYAAEQETAECLQREGYDVPEIPSEQTYVGSSQSGV